MNSTDCRDEYVFNSYNYKIILNIGLCIMNKNFFVVPLYPIDLFLCIKQRTSGANPLSRV